jgi:putative transposase
VGKKTGPSPTDRGKLGSKRSIIVDGRGVPIGFELAGANVNDCKLTFETIDSMPLPRPRTPIRRRQHFHADKGYDQKKTRTRLKMRRYIPHVRRKRRRDRRGRPVTKKDQHRWRVEAAHSWSNRFRGLKTRWEKKAANYAALTHLSFAVIALRFSGVLG